MAQMFDKENFYESKLYCQNFPFAVELNNLNAYTVLVIFIAQARVHTDCE